MAQADVAANAKLDFFGFLSGSGAVKAGGEAASTAYTSATLKYEQCFGGSPCPVNQASYLKWAESCASTPSFVKGSFAPLANLIRDPQRQVCLVCTRAIVLL